MDQILANFMAQTGADSALARDILAETNWDITSALQAYSTLTQLKEKDEAPSCTLNTTVCPASNSQHSQIKNGDEKRPARGFSAVAANSDIVSNMRSRLSGGLKLENGPNTSDTGVSTAKSHRNISTTMTSLYSRNGTNVNNPYHIETPTYTFTLPNLNDFDDDFRAFLEKDLIETASLKALEGSSHLNWWASGGTCQKLWPLATTGDGNCLLHAASLGMWGFHDRLLMLRGALHLILTKGSRRHALWRRWRWQQTHQNRQAGLIYSEDEWRAEWENILRLASPQPRSKPNSAEPLSDADQVQPDTLPNQVAADSQDEGSDTVYESLEELHVFALAHVLKRPIIVIADTVLRDAGGEAFAPIPFGGIYLPLECSPAECHSVLVRAEPDHRISFVIPVISDHVHKRAATERKSSPSNPVWAVVGLGRKRSHRPPNYAWASKYGIGRSRGKS